MDFSKCLIDVGNLSDKEIIESFKKLHPQLHQFLDAIVNLVVTKASLVRYIVACYDKESPIVLEYARKWRQKKKEAAKFAKFNKTGKRYNEDAEDVIFGKIVAVNKAIIRYLALLCDKDYEMLAILNEAMYSQSVELITYNYDKPSDAIKAQQNIVTLRANIEALERTIFSGEDVRTLKMALYEEAQRKITDLRPENIVTQLDAGLPAIEEYPYGKEYSIDKMRFISDNGEDL